MEPITREIPRMNITNITLGKAKEIRMPWFGSTHYFPEVGIRTANAIVAFEEFKAGETIKYSPNRDIVLIVQQGRAHLRYTLAGMHHTEVKELTVIRGDVYVIPSGAFVEWNVEEDKSYRHLAIMMPGFEH
jgi:hypothetical protein